MIAPPPPPAQRVIIAGSRGCVSLSAVDAAMRLQPFTVAEVVSGTARGVDLFGEQWAAMRFLPVKRFPADWNGPLKKSAGRHRNGQMAAYADALVAIWDGRSPGTQHMILTMAERGKPVFIYPC